MYPNADANPTERQVYQCEGYGCWRRWVGLIWVQTSRCYLGHWVQVGTQIDCAHKASGETLSVPQVVWTRPYTNTQIHKAAQNWFRDQTLGWETTLSIQSCYYKTTITPLHMCENLCRNLCPASLPKSSGSRKETSSDWLHVLADTYIKMMMMSTWIMMLSNTASLLLTVGDAWATSISGKFMLCMEFAVSLRLFSPSSLPEVSVDTEDFRTEVAAEHKQSGDHLLLLIPAQRLPQLCHGGRMIHPHVREEHNPVIQGRRFGSLKLSLHPHGTPPERMKLRVGDSWRASTHPLPAPLWLPCQLQRSRPPRSTSSTVHASPREGCQDEGRGKRSRSRSSRRTWRWSSRCTSPSMSRGGRKSES